MNLRDVERILRNACSGRLADDYAKLTAKTAMALADTIEQHDRPLANECKCPCHDLNSPPVFHDKPCCFQAESGTVYHETGLTPRQLADQRAELIAALGDALCCNNDLTTAEDDLLHAILARAKAVPK